MKSLANLAAGGLGAIAVVAITFVDHQHVSQLQNTALDTLQGIAGAG